MHRSHRKVIYLSGHCSTLGGAVLLGSPELAAAQLTNLWGVNCTCDKGEFANEVTGECAPCTPGNFNVDGMRYDDADFMTWDVSYWDGVQVNSPAPGVTAYCEGDGCEGWQYDDYFGGLSSGLYGPPRAHVR